MLPVQQLRLLSSAVSGRQVSVIGKATKHAARLVMTGVKQRFYGYAAMGASPTTQKRMRAVLASAGGYRKAGGCTTTAFALAGLTAADPWVEFPLETVVEFLIAHMGSGMKLANEQAWQQKLPEMARGARWGRVCGSLSAAMAFLLDAGF